MRFHRLIHRITHWLVILGYALVASGLPLPVARWPAVAPGAAAGQQQVEQRLSGKDRSQPFPCMDKPCGCATAEQCFASCCCHTPAQRLAWARAQRVAPAVVAALEHLIHREAGATCAAQAAAPPPSSVLPAAAATLPPSGSPGPAPIGWLLRWWRHWSTSSIGKLVPPVQGRLAHRHSHPPVAASYRPAVLPVAKRRSRSAPSAAPRQATIFPRPLRPPV